MPQEEDVRAYQRRSSSGKLVTVHAHQRTNADVGAEVRKLPGRPPMAAQGGQFANGRSLPNIWVAPPPAPATVTLKDGTKLPDPGVPDPAKVHAKGLADKFRGTPGADKAVAALDKLHGQPVPAPKAAPKAARKTPPAPAGGPLRVDPTSLKVSGHHDKLKVSPDTLKVVGLAKALLGDPDVIGLAGSHAVHVSSYKRTSKTGQTYDVEAYTQMRELISALGGPELAAHKGITKSLFKDLIPDHPEHGSAFDAKHHPDPKNPQPEPNLIPAITKDLLSNPDTPRSRAVTAREFQTLALRGKQRFNQLAKNFSKPLALQGDDWRHLKARAWAAVQTEWGGVTVDSHTGQNVEDDGTDQFAMTIKPEGMDSVSVPIGATEEEFNNAMEQAKHKFGNQLRIGQTHLGVFRDEDLGQIDIDPVLIVKTLDDVETIGAYTRAVGGAYNFKDGNGYWPPYVLSGAPSNGGTDTGTGQGAGAGQAGLPQGSGAVASSGGGGPGEGAAGQSLAGGRSDLSRVAGEEASEDELGLASRPIHVDSYKRRNKAGQLVDVHAYNQVRKRAAGSPQIEARMGFLRDLFGKKESPKPEPKQPEPKQPQPAAPVLPESVTLSGKVPNNVQQSFSESMQKIRAAGVEVGPLTLREAKEDSSAVVAWAQDRKFTVTPMMSDDEQITDYGLEWSAGKSISLKEDGRETADEVRQDVITHELGHVVEHRLQDQRPDAYQEILDNIVNEPVTPRHLGFRTAPADFELDKTYPRWKLDQLFDPRTKWGRSGYAVSVTSREWFAEAFADAVLHPDNPSESGKRIMEVLRRELPIGSPQQGDHRASRGRPGVPVHPAPAGAQAKAEAPGVEPHLVDVVNLPPRIRDDLEARPATPDDWRTAHRPAGPDYGTAMNDVESFMPDFYAHPEYYSQGDVGEDESVSQIMRAKGRPDAKMRIYRAVPAQYADQPLQAGDWVSTSEAYARRHGSQENAADDWPVMRYAVPAKTLYTDGNSVNEWGYWGDQSLGGMPIFKGGRNQEVRINADGITRKVKRRAKADTPSDERKARTPPKLTPRARPATPEALAEAFRRHGGPADLRLEIERIGPDEAHTDTTLRAKRGGTTVATLKWYHDGKVSWINVRPQDQNRGIAQAMLLTGQEVEPRLHHDTNLTQQGRGFVKQNPLTLDSLNPTGGLFVDYDPTGRATLPLGPDITTLAETQKKPARTPLRVYRGAPAGMQSAIQPGDFVTTDPENARNYAGNGQVLTLDTTYGDVLDSVSEPGSSEYIYRPSVPPVTPDTPKRTIQGTHVTSMSAADAIGTGGFRLAGQSVVGGPDDLGRGVYIGIPDTDGQMRSQALYEKQYRMKKTPSRTLAVEADVQNPAVIDYDKISRKLSVELRQVGPTKHKALFSQIPGFAEKYDELLAPRQKAYHDFLTSPDFGTKDGPAYPEVDPSEVLQALGYDSVMLKTKSKSAKVGGSQLVVFDPAKVRVAPIDIPTTEQRPRHPDLKAPSAPPAWTASPQEFITQARKRAESRAGYGLSADPFNQRVVKIDRQSAGTGTRLIGHSLGKFTEEPLAWKELDAPSRDNNDATYEWAEYQRPSGYVRTNGILRGPASARQTELRKKWNRIFDLLGTETDQGYTFYRGLRGEEGKNWSTTLQPGQEVVDDGVISTTGSQDFARGWLDPDTGFGLGPYAMGDDVVDSTGKKLTPEQLDSLPSGAEVEIRSGGYAGKWIKKGEDSGGSTYEKAYTPVPGSVLLAIQVPAGTRMVGASGNDIEAMLPPGTRFQVKGVDASLTPPVISLEVVPND